MTFKTLPPEDALPIGTETPETDSCLVDSLLSTLSSSRIVTPQSPQQFSSGAYSESGNLEPQIKHRKRRPHFWQYFDTIVVWHRGHNALAPPLCDTDGPELSELG